MQEKSGGKEMKIKCAKCGKVCYPCRKTSLKHPYCNKCFKETFKSEEEYYKFIEYH